jgi:hypothetical protein
MADEINTPDAGQPEKSDAAQKEELANPNAGVAHTPEIAEDNAPSTSEAVATSLPSANKPDMEPTGPEKKPKAARPPKEKPAADAEPAAKGDRPKKEKAPALEDKPFAEFMNQDFIPNLKTTLGKVGISDLDLTLTQQKLPIPGLESSGDCWQLIGRFQGGKRLFGIGFLKEDIQGQKVFYYSDNGSHPSTLESFMIDERKVTLDLLLLYTVQRLNGQKWLVRN